MKPEVSFEKGPWRHLLDKDDPLYLAVRPTEKRASNIDAALHLNQLIDRKKKRKKRR